MPGRLSRLLGAVRGAALALAAATAIVLVVAALAALGDALSGGWLLAGAGALVVLLVVVAIAAGALARRVPSGAVLKVDLRRPPPSERTGPLADALTGGRPTLRELVETLDRAAKDARVDGVLAQLERPVEGLADAEELRRAVSDLRRAGKRTVAHARSLGDLSGTSACFLASAFGEVVVQPSGRVGLVGLGREARFLRDALDRIGVAVQVERRWEYKAAAERFTEREFSGPARETAERLLRSQLERVVDGVAAARELEAEQVRAIVDRGPMGAAQAVEAGLVDATGYLDDALVRAAGSEDDVDRRLVALERYRRRRPARAPRRAPRVAVIGCAGIIAPGRSRLPVLGGVDADALARAIRRARTDTDVRAIVLRIDSPGGSYPASDAIRHEVARAREDGTPVVASMGNVAASGGYFVAAPADRIVAHPTTVTGSIGVVIGKAFAAELERRVGITTDAVQAGAHALLGSASRPWDESQRRMVSEWADQAYEDFAARVAEGRGLTRARVDEVARGRVWSGADAVDAGLVDRLGGYPEALEEARALLDLPDDAPLRLVPFPPPTPLRARLRRRQRDELRAAGALLEAAASPVGLLAGALAVAGMDEVLALAPVDALQATA